MITRYVRRHWRGQLPLSQAWWVNCVALSGALAACGSLLDPLNWMQQAGSRPTAALLGLVGLAVLVALPVWQIAGLWRTAARAGRSVRAWSGQAGATLFMLWAIVNGLSVAGHAWPTAEAALHLGPYTGRLENLHGGRELRLAGGVGFGTAARIQAAAEGGRLRRIRLAPGAIHPAERQRLQSVIRHHGLNTYAETECRQDCALVFLAGRHRSLRRGARLVLEPLRGSRDLAFLAGSGVAPWFIGRWRQLPAPWAPRPGLLRQARVVHTVLGPPAARRLDTGQRTG
jgi:hypothetical protein